MKKLVLSMLCGAIMGCADGASSTSDIDSNTEDPVTVTANRPVTTDHPANATDDIERDNSEVNVRDRDGDTKTPIDQNENAADIEITASIRSKIVDTEMSVAAQNVKIITQDKKVTLRGPVRTQEEKRSVEEIAHGVAGADNVDSQLEVDAD